MQRTLFTVLVLAVAVTVSMPTLVARQVSVAGNWDLSFNGPQGRIDASAELKQDGENVTGTIAGPQGSIECSGTIRESKLELLMTVDGGGQSITLNLVGEVDEYGENIKGTFSMGEFGTADWVGKRKK